MRTPRTIGTRRLSLAAVAALSVGLISVGPTFVGSAAAAENAGSAVIANNTLTVTGTNGADVVALDADATEIHVAFGDDPANVHSFNLADFTTISVSLGNGDDQFTERAGILANKSLTVDGGNGNDNIQTGDGNDTILGANGADTVDAGRGTDSIFLGNDDDFFVWNPGQGSDAVDGGNGNGDVLQFNGAPGNEVMSLSANGSQAVFLRDPGPVRMDMNGIEILNVRALGGTDTVTVDDVEGTAVRHVNIDLGADQTADAVTVNGTDRADRVDVSAQGGQIEVAGLRVDTLITGSETLDHLQVKTLDGNDTVAVNPNVSSLIVVGVDLGLGQI